MKRICIILKHRILNNSDGLIRDYIMEFIQKFKKVGRGFRGRIPLTFLLSILLAGCATYYNPVTEKTEYTIYTEKDEIDMGIAIDKKIQRENKIVETPDCIKEIVEKVGKNSDRPSLNYTVRVIENKGINAFAIPGGFIYLYTGLIEKIESNDELANIIGHEMGHICARDGINQLQKTLLYSISTSILLRDRSAAIQKAVDAGFTLTMLKYSREQELRADKLGVTYAYRSGYNPEGMISFFRKLQEIERKSPSLKIAFLASHPDIKDRIDNVEKVIQDLKN
ncbi:MAG: M48 family metallopeptidase [Candidatus Omnitrophica bacterium]|nr:M48 family metallopeptidase [Candidatus Omnitrophota bacterium]